MFRVLLAFCLQLSAFSAPLHATELADLGQGLGYLRVNSLAEATKPLASDHALVLDLRHPVVPAEAIPDFSAALANRHPGTRLFVLVGPDTPAALAAVLPDHLLTLGIKGSHPTPRVVVDQSREADRQAFDAQAAGTPLADLISGKIEKERFDEASLVNEFKNGNPDAAPAGLPAADAAGPALPERVTDRVLQRAMHLHRALLALHR